MHGCLSVTGLTHDGRLTASLVIDLDTGQRVPGAEITASIVVPRSFHVNSKWSDLRSCVRGLRRTSFEYDPEVICSDGWALVEGHALNDFDKIVTVLIDLTCYRVIAINEARPLWPVHSDQFLCLGRHDEPGRPDALQFAILGFRDDDQPSCGVPDSVLTIFDLGQRKQKVVDMGQELRLGERPLMFLYENEIGFLDLNSYRRGIFDISFINLQTGETRCFCYFADPNCKVAFCEETISLGVYMTQ